MSLGVLWRGFYDRIQFAVVLDSVSATFTRHPGWLECVELEEKFPGEWLCDIEDLAIFVALSGSTGRILIQ